MKLFELFSVKDKMTPKEERGLLKSRENRKRKLKDSDKEAGMDKKSAVTVEG